MQADKTMTEPDGARLAEIAYHQKQNRLVIYLTLPSMFLYAGFYYYLSNYLQVLFFVLMISNSISGLIIGNRFKNIESLTIYKRIAACIWFGLFAANLLTGLWDQSIYYVVLPWIFMYPIAAIMFISRGLGFIVGIFFSMVALIFFLVNEIPPLDGRNTILFQFNAILALLSILLMSFIYEKMRMKVQDDLAVSESQYKHAEKLQRETNIELQQEIERRWQSEKALADSELHYRALFEESAVPLWEEDWSQVKILLDALPEQTRNNLAVYFEKNPDAVDLYIHVIQISAVNQATLKLCEAESAPALIENLRKLIGSDIQGFIARRIVSIDRTGRYDSELIGTTLKGKKRHLLVSSSIPAGYETSWEKIFSSVYDETERVEMESGKKRVEKQMQSARQIQAIATLAGGIAHQFNNSLAIIFGSLDLLEANSQNNAENRRFLATLKTSAGRMSRLTDQLLAYAEGGKYQPQQISINHLINDIIRSKTMLRNSSIQVFTELDQDDCLTTGDVIQIRMVVDAVLVNAFEALQQGGTVRISTGRQILEEAVTLSEQPIKPGHYAYISIEDDGIGMKEEIIQRIFEPFFTTKIYGRGLGMAAAYGIIRNHDGMITVASERGKGTKVIIYLPVAESEENQFLFQQ